MRKFVTATVSAALCIMSIAPGVAAAQEYRFSGFDAPRGATATVNLRVPMGGDRVRPPTYGLTFSHGQIVPPGLDGRTSTRALNLADFRFAGDELRQARIASFDLANPDRSRRQMNLVGGNQTLWIVVGAVAVGAVACFVVWECFDGDDNDPAT